MKNLVYIAGTIELSPQMFATLKRAKCQDRASDVYALHGTRAECVCGQHEGLPPIAPLLLMSDEEYAAHLDQLDRRDD